MSSGGWVLRAVLGAIGWAWLGLGLAQAGVVPPIRPDLTLDTSATVTVSLYQLDSTLPAAASVTLQSPSRCTTSGTSFYKDVTDCWLPEWNPVNLGKSVYVVVNGSADPATLVPPAGTPTFPLAPGTANPFLAALTTSAYSGQCTNFGSGAEPDFLPLGPATTLPTSASTSVVGYELKPTDCGGIAVIQVGSLKFLTVPNPQPSLATSTGPVTGQVYELKPTDCGGIAVIQVGSLKFLLPKDGSATVAANGLPDLWETIYGGSLDPATDIDIGPAASSPVGDGISTFDEYRGFIVSGTQTRTDPKHKDLFLHVVNPADGVTSGSCGTSCYGGGTATYPAPTAPSATLTVPATAGTPGAIATFTTSSGVFSNAHVRGEIIGNAGGRARIVAVTGPTSATAAITQAFPPTASLSQGSWKLNESLFALVYTLVASQRLHLLGYAPGATNVLTNEWVDNFVSLIPAQTLNISDSVTDRTVNSNRLYGPIQKGVRAMEALNTNSSSVLGWSFGVASPNEAGNVVVFTQRIINYMNSLMNATGVTTLKYSTASLVNGAWTWSTAIPVPDGDPAIAQDGVATSPGVRNFILSKAFQFYTGHEIHHSLDLTPGVQGTAKTTYGNHFAPGTGDCLDQAITTTAKSGTVTFYLPSVCGTVDQAQFLIH